MKYKVLILLVALGLASCSGTSEVEFCNLKARTSKLAAEAIAGRLDGSITAARSEEMLENARKDAEKLIQMSKSIGKEPKCN